MMGAENTSLARGTRDRKAIVAVVLLATLTACKDYKPEPTCAETVSITLRNGQQVVQALNGIYLKKDFPLSACEAKPYSDDPKKRNFAVRGNEHLFWKDDRLIGPQEYGLLFKTGKWPTSTVPTIVIQISFGDIEAAKTRAPVPDWWYQPSIPHRRYPIDLLPNFGLDTPDPRAGFGPITTKPTVYWAVRGVLDPLTQRPDTTYCSMKRPPNWDGKDNSPEATKARDIAWLIQAETHTIDYIGNTCRGHTSADNGKPIVAMVDVPGMALGDIDKIYRAVSKRLSEMTVD